MPPLTIQQAFDLAQRHHQAGRLQEAEQLYRKILAQQPAHVDAMHYLGVIAHQARRNDVAVELIRQAIDLRPANPDAFNNLGISLQHLGKAAEAIAAFRQAIALRPGYAEAFNNLGAALRGKEEFDESIAAFRQAIALRPNYAEAFFNLGISFKGMNRLDESIAASRQAVALRPDHGAAHRNLGCGLGEKGQFDEAIAAFRRAIALDPGDFDSYNNLAVALRDKGDYDEAITIVRQAIASKPDNAEAYANLGCILKEKGQFDESMSACRAAIALNPRHAEAHNILGTALEATRQLEEAIAAFRMAIALKPDFAEAYNNLGAALKDTGQLDEAIAAFRQAIAIKPELAGTHSNLIYTMHFHPRYDAQSIAEELRRWNGQHAEPLRSRLPVPSNDRDPERRLRIGYVSPDFREHCQSFFMLPLLSNHDRKQVEVFCYADVSRPDEITQKLRAHADHWRNIARQSDQEVAALIQQDRIDILVDLTMHMAHNRLLVFARKPAPVQACWLAYPGSTGVSAIDYRLSDPYLDPAGMDESICSERTIRLPDSFWCYEPLDGRDVPVSPLPALDSGFITFGCLNNFCKLNDGILDLWAQVLGQVENSRLILLSPEGRHRQRTLDRLRVGGIDSTRVEFVPHQARRTYLEVHHRIDIGLDSFPYNGHTTSLDSFWMGVPVVTLVGETPVLRAGWCQLSNLGLTELAGHNAEQFANIAVAMANDLPRLAELRSTLRRRMEQSPLMDAPTFARNIEAAYREMWRTWCETVPAKN